MYDLGISDFHQVTNHPVHILNVNETFSPSAFIPFCAFGEDMKAMGKEIDGFDDPVCNSFKAKIRNDQLCYEVDLNKFKSSFSQSSLKKGFTFYVDLNQDKQYPTKVSDSEDMDFMVYLNALGNFLRINI